MLTIQEDPTHFTYNKADALSGRVIQNDGSIRPIRDTEFRMKSCPAFVPPAHQPRRDTKVFPIEYHNDDLTDGGMSPFSDVKFFYVNKQAVEARSLGYIQENITNRKRREELAALKNADVDVNKILSGSESTAVSA